MMERMEREQGKGSAEDVQARVKSVYVTCVNDKKR
jgi:hypothetical protein